MQPLLWMQLNSQPPRSFLFTLFMAVRLYLHTRAYRRRLGPFRLGSFSGHWSDALVTHCSAPGITSVMLRIIFSSKRSPPFQRGIFVQETRFLHDDLCKGRAVPKSYFLATQVHLRYCGNWVQWRTSFATLRMLQIFMLQCLLHTGTTWNATYLTSHSHRPAPSPIPLHTTRRGGARGEWRGMKMMLCSR